MIPHTISRLWWHRYLWRNATSYADLDRFPQLRPDEQRKELGQRLLRQIRYFGSRADALPEWREAARIDDPEDLFRIWPELPVITKNDLRTRFPAQEIGRRFKIVGQANSTGGSTGEPVHFFHDEEMLRSIAAAVTFSAIRMGWFPGMPIIIVWGSERDVKKETTLRNRVHGWLRNELLVDGYHLSDDTVERVYMHMGKGPVAMYGFTSMLEFVARRVLETRREIRHGVVRTAWNGGEMLFPEQSEIFRQAFGVPLLNRYGGRELSVMACQFSEGDPLNVMRPWLFLEVLDDRGRPVAPGNIGRLVWTSTVCRGTPFLRYDVEDLGTFRPCDWNESGVVAIDTLHGRLSGTVELPDGRRINNIYWNHFFKEIKEVAQFQVVLRKDGSIQILLRGDGFGAEREKQVGALLAHFLGPVPFYLQWVERIPLTKEGKLVQVYREG
jgi:phenylacetate-coenzyme A ligase PaaK-like adenylate-forming protein